MAVLEGVVGGIVTAVSFLNSMVGEAWTRYLILLAGLSISNVTGVTTGVYPIEAALGFIIANVFQIQGFAFPIYGGLSSLLMIAMVMPFVVMLFKHGLGSN